jgi:hypothetical protein
MARNADRVVPFTTESSTSSGRPWFLVEEKNRPRGTRGRKREAYFAEEPCLASFITQALRHQEGDACKSIEGILEITFPGIVYV